MAQRRILTRYGAYDERLTKALLDLARELGLEYLDAEWLTSQVHRGIWSSADGELTIVVTDDAVVDAGYLEITAVSEAIADQVARQVAVKVPVQSLDDVLAAVSTTPRSAGAVNRLGIAGPDEADPRVVDALAAALGDRDPDVRRAAANAAGLLCWPELAGPLRAAIDVESDGAVRQMAERALILTTG